MMTSFVISEYIMGTATEWISCTLLMLTYFTSVNDPEVDDLDLLADKKDRSGGAVEVQEFIVFLFRSHCVRCELRFDLSHAPLFVALSLSSDRY